MLIQLKQGLKFMRTQCIGFFSKKIYILILILLFSLSVSEECLYAECGAVDLSEIDSANDHFYTGKFKDANVYEFRPEDAEQVRYALLSDVPKKIILNSGIYKFYSPLRIKSNTLLIGSENTVLDFDFDFYRKSSIMIGDVDTDDLFSNNQSFPLQFESSNSLIHTKLRLDKNDIVMISHDVSPYFRNFFHNKSKDVWPSNKSSLKYFRKIEHKKGNIYVLDRPVFLKDAIKNFSPFIKKLSGMTSNVVLSNIKISHEIKSSNIAYLGFDGSIKNSHAHNAIRIMFSNNILLDNVSTISNSDWYHSPSRGIVVDSSFDVLVQNCSVSMPANIGNGGNGYNYLIQNSNFVYLRNSNSYKGRHNLVFHFPCSGCIVDYFKSFSSFYPSDYHHGLSHFNIIQNSKFVDDYKYSFVMKYRGSGSTGAGFTGIWNAFINVSVEDPLFLEQPLISGYETRICKVPYFETQPLEAFKIYE